MKKTIATIKQAGATFKIPVQVKDDGEIFTSDVMPVNQNEDEDVYTDEQKAAAWFEAEAEKQRYHDEINFPSSYKEML